MKNYLFFYLFIFLFFFFNKNTLGQDLTLRLSSNKENEQLTLNKIEFQKNHKTESAVYLEIDRISSYLQKEGFLTSLLDSIIKKNSLYIANFKLGKKTEKAIIKIDTQEDISYISYNQKNDSLYIGVNRISELLNFVSEELDNKGLSFSEVKLTNITLINNVFRADLFIKKSNQRKINSIITKPYSDFPKSFLKNYFNINKNTIFNQQKLTRISDDLENLGFVEKIKTPEILFTKDSTLLYIYVKKKQNNSFDGLINFSTKENGDLFFNGYLDLKLNNILNKGENFELFWNSIDDEVQDFKISTIIPYLFSTPISTQIDFNIYKQDSTFLNTKFNTSIFYSLNSKTNLFISYESENSNDLLEIPNNEVSSYSKNLIGLGFNYRVRNKNKLFEDIFNVSLNLGLGNRKSNTENTNQTKLNFDASYIWQINYRNSFYIKNKTGYLNSNSFLTNELFRIGGVNSIRGFNEQSIFTSKFSYFNNEYRYLTSQTSYLFSITDVGFYSTLDNNNEFLLGLGLGYRFTTSNNIFKISYALGKNQEQDFNVNKSQVIINWKIIF